MTNPWHNAVIYQIYPRSFQDSKNDGIGDLQGITARLDYVADLGVDAIWISPFFQSPQKDYGYDVSDYLAIDPIFGTMADFQHLIESAHKRNLRVMIDLPFCHTSDQHDWFVQSRGSRDNPKADWYIWADPKPDGSPPNNWLSVFPSEGCGWRWSSAREQYYAFNFLASQPALNWRNNEVFATLLDTMRFYLEMGVDGFRLDAINFGMMHPDLADNPPRPESERLHVTGVGQNNPLVRQYFHHINQPSLLPKLQEMRALLDEYDAGFAMAEVGVSDDPSALAAGYCDKHLLHSAYTFSLLGNEANATVLASRITKTLHDFSGKHPSWTIGNHDVKRVASRFAAGHVAATASQRNILLLCILPGILCLYQGDELGLPQADLSYDEIVDPYDKAMYPNHEGRDGARTPMPWVMGRPNAGFSLGRPWLKVDDAHYPLAVDQQQQGESILNVTRRLLKLRKRRPLWQEGECTVTSLNQDILIITRRFYGEAFYYAFNFGLNAQRVEWQGHSLALPAQGHATNDPEVAMCLLSGC